VWFGKNKENKDPIPSPDPTQSLVSGVQLMTIDKDTPVAGPSTSTQQVVTDYQVGTLQDTFHPTPLSPIYDPHAWDVAYAEASGWNHSLNPCADMYTILQ